MGTGWRGGTVPRRAVALTILGVAALAIFTGHRAGAGAAGLPGLPTSLPPPTVLTPSLPLPLPLPLVPAPPTTPDQPPPEPVASAPAAEEPETEPPPSDRREVVPGPAIDPARRTVVTTGEVTAIQLGPTGAALDLSPPSPGPAAPPGRSHDVGLAVVKPAAEPIGLFGAFAAAALALALGGVLRTRSVVPAGGGSLVVGGQTQTLTQTRPWPAPQSTAVGPSRLVPASEADELPEDLRDHCDWSDEMVARAGMVVLDVPLVSVGGGLGSFAVVGLLRLAGVHKDDIAVVTRAERPYDTFRARAEASQMDEDDLLRSDSASRIDNVWGFPGYAIEEAARRRSPRPLARVLTEPVLCEHFNPTCAQMYKGVDREAARIGWPDMLVKGRVAVVRRREGGGYFAVVAPPSETDRLGSVAIRCRYMHIGVGYPSLRLLPDLQRYRRSYGPRQMVHVYEEHDHVYDALLRTPGTVVVRGAGIAASRVLERLLDDCERHGAGTQIVHLFRHFETGPTGRRSLRRPGAEGFAYQPFNFPKAAFGGQLAGRIASLGGPERAAYVRSVGRSTTPRRDHWQDQLRRARRQGRYTVEIGQVEDVTRSSTGRVRTTIRPWYGQTRRTIEADYVIDATGLEGDVAGHRLIADLLGCGGARLNPLGRLDVDCHFEVDGARSGTGRIYASGSITLGGPVGPVDSFFGLNQAALEICDDLARQGFCARFGARRSVRAWWRWARRTPV